MPKRADPSKGEASDRPIATIELNGSYSIRFTLADGTEIDVIVSGGGEGTTNSLMLRRRLHAALLELLS
jgi:hypothetical protein